MSTSRLELVAERQLRPRKTRCHALLGVELPAHHHEALEVAGVEPPCRCLRGFREPAPAFRRRGSIAKKPYCISEVPSGAPFLSVLLYST